MLSRDNLNLVGITPISLTVIGALLSEVFSPLSESLRDAITTVSPVKKDHVISENYSNERDNPIKTISSGQNNLSANSDAPKSVTYSDRN